MTVRRFETGDEDQVREMARALLPAEPDYDFTDEAVFVWDDQGILGGFASVSLRPWSEAIESIPAPHIEAWFVMPELRRKGIGRELIEAVERWCLESGFEELGSDAATDNLGSIAAHGAIGFEPNLRVQYFRKRLAR